MSPRSAFLDLPGAVDSTGADAGAPAHYGSPLIEQRRLAAGDAVVDLAARGVLTVTGADRLTWLNSMTSQRLLGLSAGESTESLLLDANGRIEHALQLIDDGETAWLLVEAADSGGVLDWLQKMRFTLRVEIADRSDDFAVLGAFGAAAEALPAVVSNGIRLTWRDPWAAIAAGGYQYSGAASHPGLDWAWTETVVTRADAASVAARVASGQLRAAGMLAAEALRIASWRPRFAREVDERTLPHELDWLRSAVHLTKGCYRGQETVAKVHNLGHPPRRLVMLHLDGSEGVLPEPGAEVRRERDGERIVVGAITSSGLHHELGPIALAVIKRTTDPALTLSVDAGNAVLPAAQEVIVPPDAGAVANVPRIPRLGVVRRPPAP